MPRDMASLLSQPSQATPPEMDPGQARQGQDALVSAQPGSMQALMQQNPGAAMQQGAQGQPAPNAKMTNAILRHMRIFSQAYEGLLKNDDIGKADIKGPFIEAMAKLLGGGMMSLPQTMQLMKSFPEDPLQQRQWVQQHYAQDRQAALMTVMQHAKAFPMMDSAQPLNPRDGSYDHQSAMAEAIGHYKPFQRQVKKNGRD
jgi:hypothetical protein